jgi:hypothetical protein
MNSFQDPHYIYAHADPEVRRRSIRIQLLRGMQIVPLHRKTLSTPNISQESLNVTGTGTF